MLFILVENVAKCSPLLILYFAVVLLLQVFKDIRKLDSFFIHVQLNIGEPTRWHTSTVWCCHLRASYGDCIEIVSWTGLKLGFSLMSAEYLNPTWVYLEEHLQCHLWPLWFSVLFMSPLQNQKLMGWGGVGCWCQSLMRSFVVLQGISRTTRNFRGITLIKKLSLVTLNLEMSSESSTLIRNVISSEMCFCRKRKIYI